MALYPSFCLTLEYPGHRPDRFTLHIPEEMIVEVKGNGDLSPVGLPSIIRDFSPVNCPQFRPNADDLLRYLATHDGHFVGQPIAATTRADIRRMTSYASDWVL